MIKDSALIAYWIVPEEQRGVPYAIGVTAHSLDDAFALIREAGWGVERQNAKITEGITFDRLDPKHVVPNMGPMVFRGIWFPSLNVGWGASGTVPSNL